VLEFPLSRRSAVLKSFPESGSAWLDAYPQLLKDCLDYWQLSIVGTNTSGLAINMIYFVETSALESRVLKIGHPHPDQKTEMLALQRFDGKYSVPLIDDYRGAILLERIFPGTTLRLSSQNDHHLLSALTLFLNLPRPILISESKLFPTYSDWLKNAFNEYKSVDRKNDLLGEYLPLAEKLFREIDTGQSCLLHGDLHHENILLNQQGSWTAIDPKGVIGPKVMECGRYIHNFMEDGFNKELQEIELMDLVEFLMQRIKLIGEETKYDLITLAKVALIDVTLSTCWTINAGGDASHGLIRAKACHDLLRLF